jgi:hypothetical protein
MSNRKPLLLALMLVLGCSMSACKKKRSVPLQKAQTIAKKVEPVKLAGIFFDEVRRVADPFPIAEVQVFPILAEYQPKVGPYTTLAKAIQSKTAVIREINESGEVGTLEVKNTGKTAIYILAGTIVKGGKQDRQIGQDITVPPERAVAVNAFCVEHGRWTSTREGKSTEGTFVPLDVLALRGVRVAGQHKQNQHEVWSKVAKINEYHGTAPESETLLASLDSEKSRKQRGELADQMTKSMDAFAPQTQVVGAAFAIRGKIHSVRFFANHDLYQLFNRTLFLTVAQEALTARLQHPDSKEKYKAVTAVDIRNFLREIDTVPTVETRPTAGANDNIHRMSKHGYSAKSMLKAIPTSRTQGTAIPTKQAPATKSKVSVSGNYESSY